MDFFSVSDDGKILIETAGFVVIVNDSTEIAEEGLYGVGPTKDQALIDAHLWLGKNDLNISVLATTGALMEQIEKASPENPVYYHHVFSDADRENVVCTEEEYYSFKSTAKAAKQPSMRQTLSLTCTQ
jgi:hypothetical protein